MFTFSLLRASVPPCEILRAWAAVAIFLLTASTAFAAPSIKLVTGQDGKPAAIEVAGLPEERLNPFANLQPDDSQWQQLFAIYVAAEGKAENLPPMLGAYAIHDSTVRFTPRYPLRPGLTYRVVLTVEPTGRVVLKEITIPPTPRGEPTRIVTIYPTAEILPENQLRFYIHFSAPMARGEAFQHIQLLGPDGQPDTRAFFEITGEELWDASQQRLTVLFDPGRVKKGLSPHLEHGPVLQQGKKYTLALGKSWRDAKGHPLAAGFEKKFTAGPAIETAIDQKQWRIHPPAVGTHAALAIEFPHPLDHALLRRTINIESPDGATMFGTITVTKAEQRFEFKPDSPWTAGSYSLVIDTILEDTAGNRLGRPFEVDVFDRIDKNLAPETLRLPFTIQ